MITFKEFLDIFEINLENSVNKPLGGDIEIDNIICTKGEDYSIHALHGYMELHIYHLNEKILSISISLLNPTTVYINMYQRNSTIHANINDDINVLSEYNISLIEIYDAKKGI